MTENNKPEWNEYETAVLVDYLEDHFCEYKTGNKQKFHRDAAIAIQSKDPMQVKNKIRKLMEYYTKQRFKEKAPGESPSQWKYMSRFEELLGGRENVKPTELVTSNTNSEKDDNGYDTHSSTTSSYKRIKTDDDNIAQAIYHSNAIKERAAEKMVALETERLQFQKEILAFQREEAARMHEEMIFQREKTAKTYDELAKKFDIGMYNIQMQLQQIAKSKEKE
ncbi:MAG: hypothetical protein ACREHV_05105 [Rhizomicrobium sp.]